jgi:hypothetical protein
LAEIKISLAALKSDRLDFLHEGSHEKWVDSSWNGGSLPMPTVTNAQGVVSGAQQGANQGAAVATNMPSE